MIPQVPVEAGYTGAFRSRGGPVPARTDVDAMLAQSAAADAAAGKALEVALGLEYADAPMPKAYWIASYRVVSDPAKLAAYAQLAGPAIESGGGRFLARTTATRAYEDGKTERTVIIEFDSVEQAIAAHDSAGYQAALAVLADGAVRDLRIVPGV